MKQFLAKLLPSSVHGCPTPFIWLWHYLTLVNVGTWKQLSQFTWVAIKLWYTRLENYNKCESDSRVLLYPHSFFCSENRKAFYSNWTLYNSFLFNTKIFFFLFSIFFYLFFLFIYPDANRKVLQVQSAYLCVCIIASKRLNHFFFVCVVTIDREKSVLCFKKILDNSLKIISKFIMWV